MNQELLNRIQEAYENQDTIKLYENNKINESMVKDIHKLYVSGYLHLPKYCRVFGYQSVSGIKKTFKKFNLKCLKRKEMIELYGDIISEKKKQTNLERYGCENPFGNNDIQEKIKQTNLERYGVEYASQSPAIREKMNQTNLERYGSVSPFGSSIIRDKVKQTNLERFGTTSPLESAVIQEKIKRTNLERFGVEYVSQSSKIREKMNQTNLDRYGSASPFGSPKIRDKIKTTNLERFGYEYASQNSDIMEKIKQTNIERYGYSNVSQVPEIREKITNRLKTPEIREKIKKTNLERYGYENPSQSPEIQEKLRKTNLERFGTAIPMKSPEIRDKVKRTNIERYGYENPFSNPEIQEKIKQTNIERYGVEYASQSPVIKEKVKSTNIERYGVEHALQSPEILDKMIQTRKSNDSRYSKLEELVKYEPDKVPGFAYKNYTNPSEVLRRYNLYEENFSLPEIAIREILEKYEIEYQFRHRPKFMNGKELDFFIPSKNLAIEVNGLYWHSYPKKDKLYHQDKHLRCRSEGIQLLSFTEDQILDRLEIIESMILHKLGKTPYRVYAKKCDIRELNTKEAKDFLEDNHLHGFSNASVYLGLEYEGKLVHVMSFGNNRFKKSNQPELIRSASLRFHSVAGGFQRLLKYYKRSHGVDLIESYVDFNLSNGNSYELASKDVTYGDNLTEPDLWFVYKGKRYRRQMFMKHNLHKIFSDFPRRSDSNYDQFTVREFIQGRGVLEYYGAGNLKYLI